MKNSAVSRLAILRFDCTALIPFLWNTLLLYMVRESMP